MAKQQFSELATEKFRLRMRAHAEAVYTGLFPGCEVKDLRAEGVSVHVLDQHFGIDTLATFATGQWVSIQEKYRTYQYLANTRWRVDPRCPDFTQEYMNAVGTAHEAPGEWFKLGAQLYFYGWASEDESRFEKWFLMDIARYKLLVEERGGLAAIGELKQNNRHGRASFYAIPIDSLRPAWVATSDTPGLFPFS